MTNSSDFLGRSCGRMDRRAFLGGVGALGLAGTLPAVAQTPRSNTTVPTFAGPATLYAAVTDGGHNLPAIPYEKIDKRFLRQVVIDPSLSKPGTIVVDATAKFLYFVVDDGKAIRYGVSLGKAGFEWTGKANVEYKKAWPVWTPPPEMIERKPELAQYANGMPPGPKSPLGARALYLFRDGKDTMYRLHGTPEWSSIGKNASSGCVRMLNQDVIDLYSRVTGPTPVNVVHSMYLGANMSGGPSSPTTEPIDAGVPEGAERLE
ncbi:MAG TPA: L,D-transpeptidase [Rhizobiales bacterium]|nr:L,D-transpeptidase [Hyphomicrobiales bacterium]